MSGRFEFLNVGEVEVTEVDTPQVYAAPEAPRPAAENLIAIHRPAAEDPDFVEKQLDEAEMRVRIALRGLNADAGFETVVERENDAVIVRGVARTQERWQAIDDALRGIPRVRQLVVTEEEEERTQAPVPWMPEFHYSEPPLAVKQLRAVFSDPAVEQEFSDAVLGLTRSIASYAQARDQMNRLLEKRGKADEAAATRASMDEIQARMQAALDEVAQRLAPLIGSVERTQSVPDADQAMELYRQVYALIYLSGPEQTDPSAAAERIRSLLAASYEL
jgi:hypothetical protein